MIIEGEIIDFNCGIPLSSACYYGHYDIVKLLLEKGATININSGEPLSNACRGEYYDIVKLLLEKGAIINSDRQPLQFACRNGQYEIVNLLLSYLPQIMKSYISYKLYKSYDIKIREIFNKYNPLIYQLDGTINDLPDIITFNNALLMGII